MKTKRNLIQICLLGAALLALPVAGQAQYAFTTNNGAITITDYSGPAGTVTIPSATNGYPVVSIAAQAFLNKTSLTNVIVPNSNQHWGGRV